MLSNIFTDLSQREMQQQVNESADTIQGLRREHEQLTEALKIDKQDIGTLKDLIVKKEARMSGSRYLSPPDDVNQIDDAPSDIGLALPEVT